MFEFERRPSMPEEPASKRVHIQQIGREDVENLEPNDSTASTIITTTTTRPSTFGPSGQRYRSYQEDAAVEPELRSQLESIGMRTRFNVNRGYGSPPPSISATQHCSSSNSNSLNNFAQQRSLTGLITENEILNAVKTNQKSFARTQSAPLYGNELQPFGGMDIRPTLLEDSSILNKSNANSENGGMDENDDPLAAHFFNDGGDDENMIDESESVGSGSDLKRSRDIFTSSMMEGEGEGIDGELLQSQLKQQQQITKPFRQLPNSSRFLQRGENMYRSGSPFGLSRGNGATTLPVSAGLTQYLANGSTFTDQSLSHSSGDAPWTKQDFSAFTGRDDF